MIITTIAELNNLPAGTIIYDRELETYRKRRDGRWAYPAKNPELSSIAPNPMMRYGPFQTLEVLPPPYAPRATANGISDLQSLPPGAVVLGQNLARKLEDGRWSVAGKHKTWTSEYLLSHEYATLPMKVLHR